MKTLDNKAKEVQNSRAVANSNNGGHDNNDYALDNRAEATEMRNIQEMTNQSSQVQQAAQLQQIANTNPQPVTQLNENDKKKEKALNAQDPEYYKKINMIGVEDLVPGDILHLRVEGIMTGHHPIRSAIKMGQQNMLKGTKMKQQNTRAVYDRVRNDYLNNENIESDDHNPNKREDLANTGHTSIYIGNNEVVETTKQGVRRRKLENVDTARYIVMRAKNSELQRYIAEYTEAVGTQDNGMQMINNILKVNDSTGTKPALPDTEKNYLEKIIKDKDKLNIVDKYDSGEGMSVIKGQVRNEQTLKDDNNVLNGHDNAFANMIMEGNNNTVKRNTVCSSFAAMIINIAEKSLAKEKPVEIQKGATHIAPSKITPSYLEMGMKLSDNYETKGQFINVGAMANESKKENEKYKLHRPHKAYLDVTQKFLKSLSPEEILKINVPNKLYDEQSEFDIKGSSVLETKWYTQTRQTSVSIYKYLIEEQKKARKEKDEQEAKIVERIKEEREDEEEKVNNDEHKRKSSKDLYYS